MIKIIEKEGLTKVYPSSIPTIDRIAFSWENGEPFDFLAPKDVVGKKTTANAMLAIIVVVVIAAWITDGSATVAGRDVEKNPVTIRNNIGLLPQEVGLDNGLKGIANLLSAAELHHVPGSMTRNRARDLVLTTLVGELAGLSVFGRRFATLRTLLPKNALKTR